MIDFTDAKLTDKHYGGCEEKKAIKFLSDDWIIKFRKSALSFNMSSEYVSSTFFRSIGLDCQFTLQGVYNNIPVVAMKNFLKDGEVLTQFNDVGQSSLEYNGSCAYSYEDILKDISENIKLENKDSVIETFWRMFIVDAFVGNFDRHGGNWGFIKKEGKYKLAPVYDNGSTLFPGMPEEELFKILNSEDELLLRTFKIPTSPIKLKGRKSSYYDLIASNAYEECTSAREWFLSKDALKIIKEIIQKEYFYTELRKEVLCKILEYRFKYIIKGESLC